MAETYDDLALIGGRALLADRAGVALDAAPEVNGLSSADEARARSVAGKTGLPVEWVRGDLNGATERLARHDRQTLLGNSPALSGWLADPNNAALVNDDLKQMGAVENAARGVGAGTVGDLAGGTLSGVGEGYAAASRWLWRNTVDRIAPGVTRALQDTDVTAPWWILPSEIARRPGQDLKTISDAIAPDPDSTVGQVSRGLGQVGGQIALTLGTGGLSLLVRSGLVASVNAAQGADQMADMAREHGAYGSAGGDMGILAGAAVTGLAEKLGLDVLLDRFPPAVKNRVLRWTLDKVLAGAGEGASEAVEQIGQNAVAKTQYAPDLDVSDGVWQSGKIGGIVGGTARAILTAALPGHYRTTVNTEVQAHEAETFATRMATVVDAVRGTATNAQAPEAMAEFLSRADVLGDGRLGIPAAEVFSLAQSGILDEATLQKWGVDPEVFASDVAAGGDLSVPVATVVKSLADLDPTAVAAILPHLRQHPETMTVAEATAQRESAEHEASIEALAKEMEKQAKESAENDEHRTAFALMRDDMAEQLVATGRVPAKDAKTQAALAAARTMRRAQDRGMDPLDLWEEDRATVAGGEPAGGGAGEVRLSQSTTPRGKAWTALSGDVTAFTQDVHRVLQNGARRNVAVKVGETPLIFNRLGVKRRELRMFETKVEKIIKHDHPDVSADQLGRSAALLSDPVIVMKSATEPRAMVAVLDDVDANGDFLVAAIHPSDGTVSFDRLASLYGKERNPVEPGMTPTQRWLANAFNNGDVLYMNTDKAPKLSDAARTSIPAVQKARGLNPKMLTERDLVKARRGKPGLYQEKSVVRGSYTPSTNAITLFKAADRSTFAHESGHQWLLQMIDDEASDMAEARAQVSEGGDFGTWSNDWGSDDDMPFELAQDAVTVQGDELAPKDADIKTLRKAAQAYWNSHFKPETDAQGNVIKSVEVDHPELGKIQITGKGKNKFFATSANPLKLRLVPKIKEIIAASHVVGEPVLNKKNKPGDNITRYFWLEAPLDFDGQRRTVGITVFEDNLGNKFYNVNVDPKQENGPKLPHPINGGGDEPSQEGKPSLKQNIPPERDGINLLIYQTQEVTKRGSYTPSTNTIRLFGSADRSTFAHESGHQWLLQMIDDEASDMAEARAQMSEGGDFGTWSNDWGSDDDMPFELAQAARAGVDLDQRIKVINVPPFTVPGRPGKLGDALAKTIDTSPVINKDTGWTIALSRRKLNDIAGKIGKSVHHRDHIAALNEIRQIMENAIYVDDHPDSENRPGIKRVHRFFSAINVDSRLYAVKTTVLEYDDGRKDASIAAMRKLHEQRLEKEIPAGPSIGGETAGASSAEERLENQPHASQGGPTQSSDTTPLEHTEATLTLREILSGVEDTYRGGTYAQTQRGSYTPSTNTIRLFGSADRSTFAHESGHQWLFQMIDDLSDARLTEDARARITSDLGTALKYLGVKGVDLAAATPDQVKAALSVDQHETWARSVEAYLREGRAPDPALRGVFRRFAQWLTTLYRSVRQLDVSLSPEIRGVMDRLLASDDAIAQAEAARGLTLPPEILSEATPQERAALEAAMNTAHAEAVAEVLGKLNHEAATTRTRAYQQDKRAARERISAEVEALPEYAALREIRAGVPLDRGALRAEYGAAILKALPQKVSADEGGTHPDLVAEALGFESGATLVAALKRAKDMPAKTQIDSRVAEEMKRLYGDMQSDGGVNEAAVDAVVRHHPEVLAAMIRILRAKAGKTVDDIAQRTVARDGAGTVDEHWAEVKQAELDATFAETLEQAASAAVSEVTAKARSGAAIQARAAQNAAVRSTRAVLGSMDAKAISEAAHRVVSRRVVSDLNAHRHRVAAAKAGREFVLLIAKRDYQGAANALQAQAFNLALEKEVRAARTEVEKTLKNFKIIDRPDKKLAKGTDIDFIKAARAILSGYGLSRKGDFDVPDWLARLATEDAGLAQDLGAIVQRLGSNQRQWVDLSVQELFDLRDGINALQEMGRASRSMLIDGQRMEFQQIAEAARDQLQAADMLPDLPDYDHQATPKEEKKVGLMAGLAALRRVESWARSMDNGDHNGVFTRMVYRPVMRAVYAYKDQRRGTMAEMRTILEPAKDELGRKRPIAAPELGPEGFTFANKGQLIHAIAHTGNSSNKRKLLLGAKWGKDMPDGHVDSTAWDSFIRRMVNEGVVTRADFDMVQQIWDLFEKTKGPAQKAHKKMFGYEFSEITAEPVQTPFGTYRGGYVPALTSRTQAVEGAAHDSLDALEAMTQSSGAMFPTGGKGFTMSRVEYNEPLRLDLLSLPSHLDKVLRFSHIEPAVRDAARLLKNHTMQDVMRRADRHAEKSILIPWLVGAVRQTVETPSGSKAMERVDATARRLRTIAGLQAMVGNVLNAAQQITGFANAALHVKPTHLGRALILSIRQPQQLAQNIIGKSAFMRSRMDDSAYDIAHDLDGWLRDHTPVEKAAAFAQRHGYGLQQVMQNAVDTVVWQGAYEQAVAAGAVEAEAVERADAAVQQTQGLFAAEDVAAAERGLALIRLFTQFYSYFGTQLNSLTTEEGITQRTMSKAAQAKRLAWIYATTVAVPAIVGEAIMQLGRGSLGDDDDDGILDDLADLLLLSQLRYMAAFVPGVGAIANMGLNSVTGHYGGDRLSISPATSLIEGAGRIIGSTRQMMTNGDVSRLPLAASDLVALITGIPTRFVAKPLSYAINVAEGDSQPEHLGNVASGILTGRDGTE